MNLEPEGLQDFFALLREGNSSDSIQWEMIPLEIRNNLRDLLRYNISHSRMKPFLDFFAKNYLCVFSNSLYVEGQFSVVSDIHSTNMSDATKSARHKVYLNVIHNDRVPGPNSLEFNNFLSFVSLMFQSRNQI
jgi:hypothetical protein